MTDDIAPKNNPRLFHIHLISDATGTTLQGLARACLAQFDDIEPTEKLWPLIRTQKQLDKTIDEIAQQPGPILFTMVNPEMRRRLIKRAKDLDLPCLPALDPLIRGLSAYLGLPSKGIPGLQHTLNEEYFHRIDAVDFALSFDDGQSMDGIEDADVILVGVSRTSKTPTCIFLARRGIMAANIPLVPHVPFPEEALEHKDILFVGLTESPERLVGLRRSRLKADEIREAHEGNDYLDLEKVHEEVKQARRLFSKNGWPVIDVTRRSVEETAAEIQVLLQRKRAKEDNVT